jgi:hypothetical protein
MSTLYVGNFDFEHHLADLPPRTASARRSQRINRELAAVWAAIAADGDLIWGSAGVDEDFLRQLSASGMPRLTFVGIKASGGRKLPDRAEICPWGWTYPVRDLAASQGWTFDAPPQSAVRDVNARDFSFALEQEWDLLPEGAARVASLDELKAALKQLPAGCDRWVIKARFGMSARERILGRGRDLTPQAVHWVRSRLSAEPHVFLEPWLDRIAEAGIQLSISKAGAPVLEGITPMLADASGTYRGSRFHSDAGLDAIWEFAAEIGLRAALAAQRAGYFGPLGIDAMQYRDPSGQPQLRPIQDINARFTMGRIALGFRKLLKPGEKGTWLHMQWPVDDADAPRRFFNRTVARLPSEVRVVRTSPFVVDGTPVSHGTLVVIARADETLAQAEQLALGV